MVQPKTKSRPKVSTIGQHQRANSVGRLANTRARTHVTSSVHFFSSSSASAFVFVLLCFRSRLDFTRPVQRNCVVRTSAPPPFPPESLDRPRGSGLQGTSSSEGAGTKPSPWARASKGRYPQSTLFLRVLFPCKVAIPCRRHSSFTVCVPQHIPVHAHHSGTPSPITKLLAPWHNQAAQTIARRPLPPDDDRSRCPSPAYTLSHRLFHFRPNSAREK